MEIEVEVEVETEVEVEVSAVCVGLRDAAARREEMVCVYMCCALRYAGQRHAHDVKNISTLQSVLPPRSL